MSTQKKPKNPRTSPWVGEAIWKKAQDRAEELDIPFAPTMRELVTAYADGVFDIDPREVPATDSTRQGRAMYPTPDGWKRAKARALSDHGASASTMAECIVTRFANGALKVTEARPQISEAQPVRRNLLNPTGRKPNAPVKEDDKKARPA